MPTVDVIFWETTWEGYDISTRGYPSEDIAMKVIAAPRRNGEHITRIVINDNPEEVLDGKALGEFISETIKEPDFISSIYSRPEPTKVGTRVYTRVDKDKNSAKDSAAWVVFEHRGAHYKLTGRHTGDPFWPLSWAKLDTLQKVEKKVEIQTVTTWE